MSERAANYASQFEALNNEMIAAVEQCSDEQWQQKTQSEGWSVGCTAHHLAGGHGPIAGFVQAIATGSEIPPITMEMIDAGNAQHAQEFANPSKQETLEMLRSSGANAASMVRGLSDEQLDRTATLPLMGNQAVSAEQMIQMVLIGHVKEHLESIRAAQS
jgi:uncharacterized damage-inducible protein DinB